MLSFKPGLKLEHELKHLQNGMVEKYNSLVDITAREAEYLQHSSFISNIGASTRIEHAVLTDHEIDWIDTTLKKDSRTTSFESNKDFILDKLSKDRERSVEEVVGCRQVLSTVYQQSKNMIPLTNAIIRALHHDLLRYYPPGLVYAGGFKTSPNRVVFINHETGEERIVLDPAPPGMITETAMADLIHWYNQTILEYPWPLLVATEFVFRFLAIHPFQDGNGRLGRALFILALMQSDDRFLKGLTPYIAIDRHIEQNRSQYYAILHKCSSGKFYPDSENYELEPLAWFFIKIMNASLADIDLYRKRYVDVQKLSESAATVLKGFRSSPEKRLRVADMVKATGLPRRTVQYALKGLTEKELIQRLGQGAGTRYRLIF